MGYYFIKEKRTTLDASEMSESESAGLAMGVGALFVGILFLLVIAWMLIAFGVLFFILNMGALFRNHGRKFILCLVPFYNIYLCSKILVKKGWVLWAIFITLPLMLGCVTGNITVFAEFQIGNILFFCSLLILNFVLVGYFNYQISKITGAVGKGYGFRTFLDCFPIVSWVTLAIFLLRDMRKY